MFTSHQIQEPALKSTNGNKNSSFFSGTIQKKLSVGSAHDSYEVEADNIADKVMRMSDNSVHSGSLIQRKCAACEEEEKLQRKPLGENISSLIQRSSSENVEEADVPNVIENQINSGKGGGNSMDDEVKTFMENRFGLDFSDIRIHTGSEAVQMSKELNAHAFAVGNDIYFNEGKYSPNSDSGKHLLAHELTHTVQQGSKTMVQREPISATTIAAKCVLGAIVGVLIDLGIQYGGHLWRGSGDFAVDYCSLVISAVLSCIAAPIISYGIEAWIAERLANSAYAGVAGTLLGRILVWIVARAAMAVPKWVADRLLSLGCISRQQHQVISS
ncbi:DUF4157 domain-containing protein [Chryseobacterium sp.]|uniref:eCIS core domain-containing protein n=1 Tax=Chryseobacterium sp. TaxID=1871047 RepID=UPI00289CCE3D|nr:DUF4157 domain-containing protein [Chryseobacterium sp.]